MVHLMTFKVIKLQNVLVTLGHPLHSIFFKRRTKYLPQMSVRFIRYLDVLPLFFTIDPYQGSLGRLITD